MLSSICFRQKAWSSVLIVLMKAVNSGIRLSPAEQAFSVCTEKAFEKAGTFPKAVIPDQSEFMFRTC